MRVYLESQYTIGTTDYYAEAMAQGYYGVENKTGKAYKTI